MHITRKQWQWLGVFCFLAMAVWLALIGTGNQNATVIVEAIHAAGAVPFFAGLALLPLIGLPVTPFYMLGGAVFGEWICLAGVSVSLLLNLLLSYAMAHCWLSAGLERLLSRRGRPRLPEVKGRNIWVYTLAIRLAPGPPLCIKNYLVALAGVPLGPYLLVSWPIAMGYAAGFIIVGDSLTHRYWWGFLAGLVLTTVFLAAMAAGTYTAAQTSQASRSYSLPDKPSAGRVLAGRNERRSA